MLYFSHPASLAHDPRAHMPGHPDTPERLVAIERTLELVDWLGWERREAPAAAERELELIHSPHHIEAIRELCLLLKVVACLAIFRSSEARARSGYDRPQARLRVIAGEAA